MSAPSSSNIPSHVLKVFHLRVSLDFKGQHGAREGHIRVILRKCSDAILCTVPDISAFLARDARAYDVPRKYSHVSLSYGAYVDSISSRLQWQMQTRGRERVQSTDERIRHAACAR